MQTAYNIGIAAIYEKLLQEAREISEKTKARMQELTSRFECEPPGVTHEQEVGPPA